VDYNFILKESKNWKNISDDIIQQSLLTFLEKYSHIENETEALKILYTICKNYNKLEHLYTTRHYEYNARYKLTLDTHTELLYNEAEEELLDDNRFKQLNSFIKTLTSIDQFIFISITCYDEKFTTVSTRLKLFNVKLSTKQISKIYKSILKRIQTEFNPNIYTDILNNNYTYKKWKS